VKKHSISDGLTCPTPIVDGDRIQLAHGEGARLTRRLVRDEILAAFANPFLAPLADAALLPEINGRIAMTTDSSVVHPIFFPGGDIGSLAIHSAINDLSVAGAEPLYVSVALIVEEGLELAMLRRVLRSMSEAAKACDIQVVTGDTKVVPRGDVDQLFLCTTGIGRVRAGVDLGSHRVCAGDAILVSGTLGDHGLAILGAREGLDFGAQLRSDSAPLHELVARLLASGADIHFLRDPTRGGVAAVMHELTEQTGLTAHLVEAALPVSKTARGACELLGLDPLHIANEGKLVIVVADTDRSIALDALKSHPLGIHACEIGKLTNVRPSQVLMTNRFGQVRVIDEPSGAPLPRIC
jgi:hydrogenase expression/formation protein HypE